MMINTLNDDGSIKERLVKNIIATSQFIGADTILLHLPVPNHTQVGNVYLC